MTACEVVLWKLSVEVVGGTSCRLVVRLRRDGNVMMVTECGSLPLYTLAKHAHPQPVDGPGTGSFARLKISFNDVALIIHRVLRI
mgnify:CR=1 FL=1